MTGDYEIVPMISYDLFKHLPNCHNDNNSNNSNSNSNNDNNNNNNNKKKESPKELMRAHVFLFIAYLGNFCSECLPQSSYKSMTPVPDPCSTPAT